MGITVFACEVATKATLEKAIETILRHNTAPLNPLGYQYTDAVFAELDPARFNMISMVKKELSKRQPDLEYTTGGCQEAWTRGEDINTKSAVLVRFRDKLWLEVTNGAGGACTTLWLEANSDLTWFGTRGKPAGFIDAPVACKHAPLLQLLDQY